uniref:Translocator protein n=1 Tax=Lygus hesperus TaxID=30085 RepID=A0A0A9XVP4_LYGHE
MADQQLTHMKWLPSFGLCAFVLMTDSATGMNWDWYCSLNQPPWDHTADYPTHFFFPIALLLNIGAGISSYAVWRDGGGLDGAALPLGLYSAQLVLQWTYIPLLMGFKSIRWSLLNISLATGMATHALVLFKNINEKTFPFMLPYVIFLSLANVHTLALYAFNRENRAINSRTPGNQGEQTAI